MKPTSFDSRILHRRPRLDVVVDNMDKDPKHIDTHEIGGRLEVRAMNLALDVGNCTPHDGKVIELFDAMTLVLLERAALQTAVVILTDGEVQALLPQLRTAWQGARSVVSPHEADNILRDPKGDTERQVISDLRDAWIPVRTAAQVALDRARRMDKGKAPTPEA